MSKMRNIRCYFDEDGSFQDVDFQDIISFVGENNALDVLKEFESKLLEVMETVKNTKLTYDVAKKIILNADNTFGVSTRDGVSWILNFNFHPSPKAGGKRTPATFAVYDNEFFTIISPLLKRQWKGTGVSEFRKAIDELAEALKQNGVYSFRKVFEGQILDN